MPNTPAVDRPTPPDWGLRVVPSILWGGSFCFVGVAVAELPPLTIAVTRVLPAAAALAVVLRVSGARLPRGALMDGGDGRQAPPLRP